MANVRVLSSNLSVKELRKLKQTIVKYRHEVVQNALQEGITTLLDEGGKIARNCLDETEDFDDNLGKYVNVEKDYPKFSKYNYQQKGELRIRNAMENTKEWETKEGVKSVVVNSVMMAEFGSGEGAKTTGHRGTFPNQKHAFDKEWHWKRPDGTLGNSSGIQATRPMHWADIQIKSDIEMAFENAFAKQPLDTK